MTRRRGRPRNPTRSVRLVLTGWLHPEYDADIIAWLDAIPLGQRINAFKLAVRSGGLGLKPADADNNQADIQAAADSILGNWEF